jgi:hypothetical protein
MYNHVDFYYVCGMLIFPWDFYFIGILFRSVFISFFCRIGVGYFLQIYLCYSFSNYVFIALETIGNNLLLVQIKFWKNRVLMTLKYPIYILFLRIKDLVPLQLHRCAGAFVEPSLIR